MIRRATIILVALALNPALVRAQDTVFTIDVPSAEVHKGPSTVNPVVGQVPRGTELAVSRTLGSWVKVSWPDAEGGVAYVHVSMGHVGPPRPANAAAATSTPRAPERAAAAATAPPIVPPMPQTKPRTPRAPGESSRPAATATPASHLFGVGGMISSVDTLGATARAWSANRIGVQLGVTRSAFSNAGAIGRVTSMQFEPGVVYGLFDRVTDYVWVRPYAGTALSVARQTLNGSTSAPLSSASDTGVGYRVFGGTELMFASAPQFGLTADLGYRRLPTPFAGFEPTRLTVGIGGHWYIK